MTPAEFAGAYGPTADAVSHGTGIDSTVLLAQWANETDWGQVVVGFNLGNIRSAAGPFLRFNSLGDFALECIATWHNGYYGAVLAATGPEAQLAAVCASPWSSGHYGGSLQSFYDPLEVLMSLTPAQDAALTELLAGVRILTGTLVTTNPADASYRAAFVDEIKSAVANPAPATVNLQPVLDAIATNDAELDTAIGNVLTAVSNLQVALKTLSLKAA